MFDQLGNITRDDERDVEYEAMTIIDAMRRYSDMSDSTFEELRNRTISRSAKPVIYPISATPKLNSEIAVDFKDKLQRQMINLLVEIEKGENYLIEKNQDYRTACEESDYTEKAKLINPYSQTNEMINECVNLDYTVVSGLIKLDDKKARKDRYTSVSYGSYFASQLERDLLYEEDDSNNFDEWAAILGF